MENVTLTAALESAAQAQAIAQQASVADMMPALNEVPVLRDRSDNMLGKYNNAAAAVFGGALAVGLELASPTGSKASAAAAAVMVTVGIVAGRNAHTKAPQNAITMAGSAYLGWKLGRMGGRTVAEYFPQTSKEIEADFPVIAQEAII